MKKFNLTETQKVKALYYLSFWHVFIIALSNYLVQKPFTLWDFHTTWGAFSFPFIFVTTDLTVRIFGNVLARKIIFAAMFPAFFVSYLMSVLFHEGKFSDWSALNNVNIMVIRISLASFLAYVSGQLLDISVFNRLRKLPQWWIAPTASAVLGNLLDTVIFFSTSFYRSNDEFLATHWKEIAAVDYTWKLIISGLFFLPIYGILLKYLTKRLTTIEEKIPELVSEN